MTPPLPLPTGAQLALTGTRLKTQSNPIVSRYMIPKKDPQTNMGYIVPYWVSLEQCPFNNEETHIILPLKDGLDKNRIAEEIKRLRSETILFLKKISKFKVITA